MPYSPFTHSIYRRSIPARYFCSFYMLKKLCDEKVKAGKMQENSDFSRETLALILGLVEWMIRAISFRTGLPTSQWAICGCWIHLLTSNRTERLLGLAGYWGRSWYCSTSVEVVEWRRPLFRVCSRLYLVTARLNCLDEYRISKEQRQIRPRTPICHHIFFSSGENPIYPI